MSMASAACDDVLEGETPSSCVRGLLVVRSGSRLRAGYADCYVGRIARGLSPSTPRERSVVMERCLLEGETPSSRVRSSINGEAD